MRKRTLTLLALLLCLIGAFLMFVPGSKAFASDVVGSRGKSFQPGQFAHVFTGTRPAGVAPGCSGIGCNRTDPYSEDCAGQWWDTWGVLTTTPVRDPSGRSAGYLQLWWSDTCQTNWGRIVAQVPYALEWATVWTNNGYESPPLNGPGGPENAGGALISGQLYAPIALACTQGNLNIYTSNGQVDIYSGVTGQYTSC